MRDELVQGKVLLVLLLVYLYTRKSLSWNFLFTRPKVHIPLVIIVVRSLAVCRRVVIMLP